MDDAKQPQGAACADQQRLIIAGHSHMVAMTGDMPADAPHLHTASAFPNVYALFGAWPRSRDYWSKLSEVAKEARVAIVWGGNEHNFFFFFQANQPFDFISKSVNQIISSFQIVPQAMVREKFRPHVQELAEVLAELKKTSIGPLAVVGTPPPKEGSEELRQLLKTEPYFVEWAEKLGKSIDTIKITAAPVRLKLWYVLQEMLAQIARDADVQFIPVAPETVDENGYLRREYWAPDVTHANAEYGQVMMRKIIAELS